jgi:hypothetical protein
LDFSAQETFVAGFHDRDNLWASCNIQEINLRNQIIEKFYDLEARKMRFLRNSNPEFYTFTKNDCIERLRENVRDRQAN